jgi:hypothetical protein
MAYRIAGDNTELCSCDAPCPCAFGQTPTGGTCQGIFCLDVQEGEVDGVSVSGTHVILAAMFNGPWTAGNFTAAMILDSNASQEQRDALTKVFSGELGGEAAQLAGLIGDMKGVFEAPIEYQHTGTEVRVRAGDLAAGEGAVLMGSDDRYAIQLSNALYPMPQVQAGKASNVMVNVEGINFQHDGHGMWTGPFVLQG